MLFRSDYLEQASEPKPQRGMKLDEDDRLRRQVIEGLMCQAEIRFDEFDGNGFDFQEYFKDTREAFEGFEADGLVRLGPDCKSLPTADVFSCAT